MSKKEDILKTALRLFIENGINKTPTAKIASEAGVATGTLFHHFKNKEELVNALYRTVKDNITDAMGRGLKDLKSSKEISRKMWDNFIEWSLSNPELFQFNTLVCESSVINRKTKLYITEQSYQFLTKHFNDATTDVPPRDLPFELWLMLSGSVLTRTAQYFVENPEELENSVIVNEAFEAYFGMLAKL